jgi:predicted MFS family arabinose efflux permease
LNKRFILPLIVFSQFACTSLWFAGNAVIGDVIKQFGLQPTALAHITSSVQFGFITGTLIFAILQISDRVSPSKVFFTCAILGAIANLSMFAATGFVILILSRFMTGFFLAGIYPVGMKIASDYHNRGLGKALGFLVGALVLGTASPHLLKSVTATFSWKYVIAITSVLAIIGGLIMRLFVPDGPYRTAGSTFKSNAFINLFKNDKFRSAAFGYFGHMWELYTFWAFVPVLLIQYFKADTDVHYSIPLLAFIIIAIGCLGCIAGGYISQNIGSARTAFTALTISGLCCLLSPLLFQLPMLIMLVILLIWSTAVVTDSPQFSTLVALYAPANVKGTALTLVNSIGFFITIVSIQFLTYVNTIINQKYIYLFLAAGPALGLLAMRPLVGTNKAS